MEEMLGNIAGARQIFERWMQWEPDHQGWRSYIKFESRYQNVDNARGVYERYVRCHPTVKAWVNYAKFEGKLGERERARRVYETAVMELGLDANTIDLFSKFAQFEEFCKEVERARAIYKYALDHVTKEEAEELYKEYMRFEKKHGNRADIENVISRKKRLEYEDSLKGDAMNYDVWFDYLRLEEGMGTHESIRTLYERAIANVPPAKEKRFWQRYIYLWIKYALFEELIACDVARTRDVYRQCLKLVPHRTFSFSKLWLLAAHFEIRQKNLKGARKVFGMALGMAPKPKIFASYIEVEMQLGNVDRCRRLYEKLLETCPMSCEAWVNFADLEATLGETERARAIFELGVSQASLDKPEVLWKTFIDFEIAEGEREGARTLYERLLERTKHVKVWLSYAKFEATPLRKLLHVKGADEGDGGVGGAEEGRGDGEDGGDAPTADMVAKARAIYGRAYKHFREVSPDMKEECVMVLEAWLALERAHGTSEAAEGVQAKMPRQVKRRRALRDGAGEEVGIEEYYDYIFPEEAGAAPNLKLLQAAYQWKKRKVGDE